jgi:predicted nucleic acid-binding protein
MQSLQVFRSQEPLSILLVSYMKDFFRLRLSHTHISVSFMSFMEGRYRTWQNAGKEESEEFSQYLNLLPLERINITDLIFEKAIEIKATNSLSVSDSWIIATAIVTGSVLVHKDPEFEQVKTLVKLRTLPYKTIREK